MDDSPAERPCSRFRSAVLANWRCPSGETTSQIRPSSPSENASHSWQQRFQPDQPSITVPSEDLSETQEIHELLAAIICSAEEDAVRVADLLETVIVDMKKNGCVEPVDVPDYFHKSWKTLAQLYQAAVVNPPSPTTLKRLALQYALDPRKAIDGDVNRFEVRSAEGVCELIEYSHVSQKLLPFSKPGRIISHPFAIRILDYVFSSPPQIWNLMEFLERLFGGIPEGNTHLSEKLETERQRRPRLVIDVETATCTLNNVTHRLKPAEIAFLKALQDAEGRWVSCTDFENSPVICKRPDRVRKRLPTELQKLIDPAPGKGFRLLTEKMA